MMTNNLVMADCPNTMEDNNMKQSDKITALYCRLSIRLERKLGIRDFGTN